MAIISYDIYETCDGEPRRIMTAKPARDAAAMSAALSRIHRRAFFPSPVIADEHGLYRTSEDLEIEEAKK